MSPNEDFYRAAITAVAFIAMIAVAIIGIPAIIVDTSFTVGSDSVIVAIGAIFTALFVLGLIFSIPAFSSQNYDGNYDRREFQRRSGRDRRASIRSEDDRRQNDRREY